MLQPLSFFSKRTSRKSCGDIIQKTLPKSNKYSSFILKTVLESNSYLEIFSPLPQTIIFLAFYVQILLLNEIIFCNFVSIIKAD